MYLDFYEQHERVQLYRLRWVLLVRVVTRKEMAALNHLGQTPRPRHAQHPCRADPLLFSPAWSAAEFQERHGHPSSREFSIELSL